MALRPIKHIKNWYARNERRLSALSLFGGFAFDIFTLERVDEVFENIWIVGHIVIVAICIILLNLIERGKKEEHVPGRHHFWLVLTMQFMFGGILSAFLVFYFRSATLATSWPFMLLLVLTFMSNESFKHYYTRMTFQIAVFFVSIYSFAIYMVPILLHRVGDDIFVLSGLASLAIIGLFIRLLNAITKEKFQKSRNLLFWMITTIFIMINVLYFTNLIPPLPLSLKDSGVYHKITKDPTTGEYILTGESVDDSPDAKIARFFERYPVYHQVPGEPVNVYSAVFSPTAFSTKIVHHWEYYNEQEGKWQDVTRITLPIVGGRSEGFRTFSSRYDLEPGYWRVDVETENGQDIGRVRWRVE